MQTYPDAYKQYLFHFHVTRDYFECHELLEEYWKSTQERNANWVGLIQLAVAFYHFRRGNYKGASKMMQGAYEHVNDEKLTGLHVIELKNCIKKWMMKIEERADYFDCELPFFDQKFEHELKQYATEKGYHWGSPSNFNNLELIHRHTRRDRTDVIQARKDSLIRKRGIAINDEL